MALQLQDPRTREADSHFARLTQSGVDPDVANALLPAFVSSNSGLADRAQRFADQRGRIGYNPTNPNHATPTVNAAKAFIRNEMERGSFAGEQAFRPGSRYVTSESASNDQLDRQSARSSYGDGDENSRRLALSDVEQKMQLKHRDHRVRVHDDGRVTDAQGQTLETVQVPQRSKSSDVSRWQQGQSETGLSTLERNTIDFSNTVHYKSAAATEWPEGPDRPYFADRD